MVTIAITLKIKSEWYVINNYKDILIWLPKLSIQRVTARHRGVIYGTVAT
jgi:hypothetical protein